MTTIRIFVSSPGDVAMERVCAERVIKRLGIEFSGEAKIEPFFWEHEPMRATASFNSPENIPPTANFDIMICILWSRLGTMLSKRFKRNNGEPYPSGTAYEIETAIDAYREHETPDLLVYRRVQQVAMPVNNPREWEEKERQVKALEAFIKSWFFNEDSTFKGAFTEYTALGQFESKLERPLRSLIKQHLDKDKEVGGRSLLERLASTYRGGNPYRGLDCYDFDDAEIFFGRSQAIEDVLKLMRSQAEAGRAFTLVHGISGSGKSSLLRAGVLPVLSHPGVAEGVAYWRRAVLLPGSTPGGLLSELAVALLADEALPQLHQEGFDVEKLKDKLESTPEAILPAITRALQFEAREIAERESLPEPPSTKLVLLVDQLEQIFSGTSGHTKAEYQAFANALVVLAKSGLIWICATIRSDVLGKLTEELPALAELSQGGQYGLLAPTENDLDMMIRLPARAAGAFFQEHPQTKERLELRLLREARKAPDGLPLLGFVLRELYERKQDDEAGWMLTHEALDALGGLEGAVQSRADAIFKEFLSAHPNHDSAGTLDTLARALATVGNDEDAPALRRISSASVFEQKGELSKLVSALVEGRLLTKGVDATGKSTLFVTHEALLRKWGALSQAIKRNKSFLKLRSQASASTAHWISRGKPTGLLWDRGLLLQDATALYKEKEHLQTDEQEFIHSSILSSGKRKNRLVIITGALLVAVGLIAWLVKAQLEQKQTKVDDFVNKQEQIKELEGQLDSAMADLNKQLWPTQTKLTSDEEQPSWMQEKSPTQLFPALDITEITDRLLTLQPGHKKAFEGKVMAYIHHPFTDSEKSNREETLKGYFEEWQKLGLSSDTLLDLQAQKLWLEGKNEQAISLWASYLKTPGLDDSIKRRLSERVSAFFIDSGKWRDAEITLNSWLSWDENATARIRRAKTAIQSMEFEKAEQDFNKAKELDAENPEVIALAPLLERIQSQKKAIADATKGVQGSAAATQPFPWLDRARVLLIADMPDLALNDIEKAIKIMKGKSPFLEFMRVMCLSRAKKPIPQDTKIVALNSFDMQGAQFEEWMGRCWQNFVKMLTLDTVIASGVDTIQTRNQRAQLMWWLFQGNLGLIDCDAALRLKPDDLEATYWKVSHLISLEKNGEAVLICDKALVDYPDSADLMHRKAEAQLKLNQPDKALVTVNQALSMQKWLVLYELRANIYRALNRTKDADADDATVHQMRSQNSN